MAEHPAQHHLRILSTPRAAAFAGVLFAILFGTALVLIRTALPEGGTPGSQWVDGTAGKLKLVSMLMPFSGIAFLWFIGVVRDGFGKFEDKFFSSVFIGSGLLFLAMMFATSAAGAGLVASRSLVTDAASRGFRIRPGHAELAEQHLRTAHGWRVHDLAGHDLVEDQADAGVVGRGDLHCRAEPFDRQRPQHVDRAGIPRLGLGR
jgi:hypothetical protein